MHLGVGDYVGTMLWLAEIVCFLLSAFGRPKVGLYFLVPMLPLQTIRYRLHGYFLGAQFIDVLLLGIILGLKRQNREVIPRTPLNFLLFVYMAFTYLSMVRGSFFLDTGLPIWFDDPRVSMWKNYVVDLCLIFFVTASVIRTKREIAQLIFVMCIGCLLLAKGFHNVAGSRDFSAFSYELRDSGPMGGAGVNGLAAFAAQISVFLTSLCIVRQRFSTRLGYIVTVAACVYCLIFALSRGGYLGFIVGMLYLGVTRSRLLLLGLFAFLLTWQSFVPTAVSERVLMTSDGGGVDPSSAARLTLWQEAARVFEADPIFGMGFNTYAFGSHFEGYRDTHNVYVKVLVETGISGLLLFLAIFFTIFRIGLRLKKTASDEFLRSIGVGLSTLMVTVAITNFFGDRWMYFQITGYTYAFAALAVRAQQITDEGAEEEDPEDEPAIGMELAQTVV